MSSMITVPMLKNAQLGISVTHRVMTVWYSTRRYQGIPADPAGLIQDYLGTVGSGEIADDSDDNDGG